MVYLNVKCSLDQMGIQRLKDKLWGSQDSIVICSYVLHTILIIDVKHINKNIIVADDYSLAMAA